MINRRIFITIIILSCCFLVVGCGSSQITEPPDPPQVSSPVEEIAPENLTPRDLIVMRAREEVENRVFYDASYVSLDYPNGDVELDRGACTDLVIRAFREVGVDLQQLIHEDMLDNFSEYPQLWGLTRPDPNIDHRRVPNQIKYLQRHGITATMDVENSLDQWHWGDVVFWRFPNGMYHCGIVSDKTNSQGIPLVIHNANITTEEDCLLEWEIIGHFRLK